MRVDPIVGTERFGVGEIDCRRLIHGAGRGTPAWMFPDVPSDALLDRMAPYLDSDATFEFVYSSLLLDVGGDIALIDTSVPSPVSGARSSIDRHLDALGVDAADVGTVVITHAHLDHVGGLVRDGAPVFRNARHVIHRAELDHWLPDAEIGSLLQPLVDAQSVEVVDTQTADVADGAQEVLPGVSVLPTPGHTPGHLAVSITSGGAHAIYVGDLLAHEVNVAEPGWDHFSDMDPPLATRSRRALVAYAARERADLIGAHLVRRIPASA